MLTNLTRLTGAILLLAAAQGVADDRVSQALAASAGSWEGELYYVDYQSGQRFAIPMKADVEARSGERTT